MITHEMRLIIPGNPNKTYNLKFNIFDNFITVSNDVNYVWKTTELSEAFELTRKALMASHPATSMTPLSMIKKKFLESIIDIDGMNLKPISAIPLKMAAIEDFIKGCESFKPLSTEYNKAVLYLNMLNRLYPSATEKWESGKVEDTISLIDQIIPHIDR
ncbi:MAG: hypothetical protein WC284_08815 [Candidimonas sp.]